MGANSKIEWTDATWNPVRGCSRVSEGCRHCYAESVAYRFSGGGQPYAGLAVLKNGHASWTGKVEFVEKHLLDPLRWKKPRRIFVNSMSDLFHESVQDEWIDKIFAVMALCPQHQFQVLTKRPARMLRYLTEYPESRQELCWRWHVAQVIDTMYPQRTVATVDAKERAIEGSPLPNIWLGVSVENQAAADERIPLLLEAPAAVRFISAEPLLGAVDLTNVREEYSERAALYRNALQPAPIPFQAPALDWVICGGESGPHARPMRPDWARSLRDQCAAAEVPFFFKQWGEWGPGENVEAISGSVKTAKWFDGKFLFDREDLANDESHRDDEPDLYRVGKHAAAALLDGVEHKQFPGEAL